MEKRRKEVKRREVVSGDFCGLLKSLHTNVDSLRLLSVSALLDGHNSSIFVEKVKPWCCGKAKLMGTVVKAPVPPSPTAQKSPEVSSITEQH